MTTIRTWLKQLTVEEFLKSKKSALLKAGCSFEYEKPYDATKTYAEGDLITAQGEDLLWYYYQSLQDDNTGHSYNDAEYWLKKEVITDIITVEAFEVMKSNSENLNFFVMSNNINDLKARNLCLLCLCADVYTATVGIDDMAVNSSSIDGMSVSGEIASMFKLYPWLHNQIGMEYLINRASLIGTSDVYGQPVYPIATITTKM